MGKPKELRMWPEPEDDLPYGPSFKQSLMFTEKLDAAIRTEFASWHGIDVVAVYGGKRSGKTLASAVRAISYLQENPGAIAIIGAENFPILQRTQLEAWEKIFTEKTPWDHLKRKDRIITKKPTQNDKRVIFKNGSIAYFLHFNDPKILRGINADLIVFEEASLLPDEEAFKELRTRLSGKAGPIRQLILLTNPSGRGGWVEDVFGMNKGDKGPKCKPCNCQICQKCLNSNTVDSQEYVDGICPTCGSKKKTTCPGNQVWFRTIKIASTDNPHIPQDFVQSQKGAADSKTFQADIMGDSNDIREGYAYKAFNEDHIFGTTQAISMEKELIWTLDFNIDPQCSVIAQEDETTNGFEVKILKEIVMWNSLPEHAAERFCQDPDIQEWNRSGLEVMIYGDPAGLFGTGHDLIPSFYEIIRRILLKNGFRPKVMMRKPDPNAPIKETLKIFVEPRIDAVNCMLQDPENPTMVRMRLNPECINLIKSLRELRVGPDGRGIDKRCDRRAQNNTDKSQAILMSHPTDALGYYIFKRFPVFKNKRGIQFFQVPGQSRVSLERGRVNQSKFEDHEERRLAKEQRRAEREQRRAKRQNTLGRFLKDNGLWPGSGDMFFGS